MVSRKKMIATGLLLLSLAGTSAVLTGCGSDEQPQQQMQAAQDIIDRLNREAAQDEAIKQMEIEAVKASMENTFNATTGANSGLYGATGADADHKSQIDAILAEKDDAFQSMLDDAF